MCTLAAYESSRVMRNVEMKGMHVKIWVQKLMNEI